MPWLWLHDVNGGRYYAISRLRCSMHESGEGDEPIVSDATRAVDFAIENGRRLFEGRAAMVTRRTSVSGAASEQVVPEVPECHRFPLRGSRRCAAGIR